MTISFSASLEPCVRSRTQVIVGKKQSMAPNQKVESNSQHDSNRIRAGKKLAQPPAGEEIVISGVAGNFPESHNVKHFQKNLFNKMDMVTDDGRRWKFDHPEIPQRTGKLLVVNKFDASFFGVHFKQAETMDPMCRMLLERTYEAIVDAGIHPRTLKGQNAGVFIGACFSESEKTWFYEKISVEGCGITGVSRAMMANRISFWLGVNGPSYTVDSACSSSMYALEHAYKAIRDGHCDSAIVGGCNLCLHPYVSLQFSRLGVLSPQGKCKSFDRDANGYTRSEAICVVFLQKSRDAKRIYATLVHAKTNCDGYKEQGITYPSGQMQKMLLSEFYEECGVSPTMIGYIEAHGTGTKVGDPEELNALDQVFTKGRQEPLLIGSVKSNIGHSEPASGLCSLTKAIIALETGMIPPNLHYMNPREGVLGLEEGRFKVVTEPFPLPGNMIGINSFGFGGANAHALLKANPKTKVNGGAPSDPLPRLVVASGRTNEAVDIMLKDVESRPVDVEYVGLLHNIHETETIGHVYRGYTLLTQDNRKIRNIQYYPGAKRPVWFVFTGMGSQWPGMGRDLMKIPVFAAAIQKCHNALKPHGVDLTRIITTDEPTVFNNILNCFVGIAACQVGLVDILNEIGIEPDGIVGHSVGELGCSYQDGCFTAEQMVLAAYYRGLASIETKLVHGLMAAVGLGAKEVRPLCPPDIEVACHNGPNFCTLSGPAESMKKFVKSLQQKGVFAKEVNCANIAYHSRYIAECGPLLLKYLKKVIPNPKPRSSKWICSSVPKSAWNTPLATHSSAEYHTNNLLSPVLFEEASKHIPHNAITVEIAPHGLLQAILKRSLHKNTTNIALTERGNSKSIEFLFNALGKLYIEGLNPKLANLYPRVQYPVSRGTPMISPLVRWEHSEDWHVTSFALQEKVKSGERTVLVKLQDDDFEYVAGHIIDGRILFPAMGYVALVWESVGMMTGKIFTEISVVFENLRFHRATNIPKEGSVEFIVMIQRGSGKFEIAEGGAAIVSGSVTIVDDASKTFAKMDPPEEEPNEELIDLSSRDIYKELRLRGYGYQGLFRSIQKADNLGQTGYIWWKHNWVAFMDNLLQMQILQEDTRGLFVPTSIERLAISPKHHIALIQKSEMQEIVIPVYVYKDVNIICSGGVEVRGLKASAISKRKPLGEPVLEKYVFVSNAEPEELDLKSCLRVCAHIALENQQGIQVKTLEIYKENLALLSPELALILGDLPLIQADITILANPSNPAFAELVPSGYKIEDHKLHGEQNCLLVIVPDILHDSDLLKIALSTLATGACILARERLDTETKLTNKYGLEIIFEKTLENEKLILLKKGAKEDSEEPIVIKVNSNSYDWLPQIQAAIADRPNYPDRPIYMVAQGEHLNGILGLVNCIRKEPGGDIVRCIFILDKTAPKFDFNLPFYKQQLNKNLAMNMYRNGKWGSYRHLNLESLPTVRVPHAYVNVMTRGDLSSLKWLEGNINPQRIQTKPKEELVQIYYSALNFRDVMTATGKLAAEVVAKGRLNQDCVQGLEYAGRDTKGNRVMGMVGAGALASMVIGDKDLMWIIPDHWTMEDAATVPVVYGTAFYALIISGRMEKGDSVLIHAGSGGVGQAAINISLHMGCTVYTTVGTQEKREFIKRRFPQLTDRNIGNSRDTSFEQLIMAETKGRGVDLVLNSLAEEKLQASLRCLAQGGRFLEIGKFDLANNNPLGMEVFLKQTSFHGIMLDNLFLAPSEWKKELHDIVTEGIRSGAVQPLTRTVFSDNEVEQAFRYMAAGKHIGKVLVQIRPEEDKKIIIPAPKLMEVTPLYFCNPDHSYIIAGGLGGFGLELADWLVLRGARKLVLTSRTGVRTGYQSARIRVWRSYGAKVKISLADITTESGVKELLVQANNMGPVDAIFNLAVVLRDALLENQTEADFVASAGPKATATHHLDILSRKLCPKLRHFVVFSSVSCGRGNAGQTNYGMSNSVMERICEARVRDGLPGLAIQWGAVGEVGLVADMQEENTEIVIGGTLPQKISSCLEELDRFMKQNYPIVASMVVAEKRVGGTSSGDMVDVVSSILGIRDLKTVSLHSTLAELGMDSMMAVEIKQSLEREFEIFLTPQEIRSLTFARLSELAVAKEEEEEHKTTDNTAVPEVQSIEGLHFLVRVIGDESAASKMVVRLPSATGTDTDAGKTEHVLFMFPGVEGMASVLEPLAKNLHFHTVCLQLGYNNSTPTTVEEISSILIPHILSHISSGTRFSLLGYSFGGLLALEVALQLEAQGWEGNLFLVDSSPMFMHEAAIASLGEDEDYLDMKVIAAIMNLLVPKQATTENVKKLLKEITPLKDYSTRLHYFLNAFPSDVYSLEYQQAVGLSTYNRIKALLQYRWPKNKTVKSRTTLIRPSVSAVKIAEDYCLSEICEKKVDVNLVPGNHVTILETSEATAAINKILE